MDKNNTSLQLSEVELEIRDIEYKLITFPVQFLLALILLFLSFKFI